MRLVDTATGVARPLRPLTPGRVTIYVCGATVHGPPHLGHLRSAITFDLLRRWLQHQGLEVLLVRNVTDIDDIILAKARAEGRPWWEWAATHERAFTAAYDAVGCLPPSAEPRATGHIAEAVELVRRLVARGHAYLGTAGDDGGRDVLFDVASWPGYGRLSGVRADHVRSDPELVRHKRDPRDFALWKAAKTDEPRWPSPWGAGRPSWHVECSAMSTRYLGPAFDIHGGGRDLVFPHHENEMAQSRAAGDDFAASWLHHGWVTVDGDKMSKSAGNAVDAAAALGRVRPIELRAYLLAAHHRSTIDYSDTALREAAAGYRRIEALLDRVRPRGGAVEVGELPAAFAAALDDDLATPAAMSVLHTATRDGNAALERGDRRTARGIGGAVRAMTSVLGIDPHDPTWAGRHVSGAAGHALEGLVEELLDERSRARAGGDFARADEVRERLRRVGVDVEDTPDGPRWALAR
ncbi:cysteine--tRNA ligase [Actinomycetospora straminea]|uniref:Cysteine--tRNA ligase n=1 Tax=Actinomycetospora straminea TaxID=663607 RepID=A0ABP9EI67_9PSEU